MTGLDIGVRHAATDVLLRYATRIDPRDWTLLRSCFTDDCDDREGLHTAGFYDDDLVEADGGWRIARRRFTLVPMRTVRSSSPEHASGFGDGI